MRPEGREARALHLVVVVVVVVAVVAVLVVVVMGAVALELKMSEKRLLQRRVAVLD